MGEVELAHASLTLHPLSLPTMLIIILFKSVPVYQLIPLTSTLKVTGNLKVAELYGERKHQGEMIHFIFEVCRPTQKRHINESRSFKKNYNTCTKVNTCYNYHKSMGPFLSDLNVQ